MIFYCKNCKNEFEINNKECEGYYNWKCPECMNISIKKDMRHGFGIIWNCDPGTAKRRSYIDTKKCEAKDSKSEKCDCCSNKK